MKRHNFSILNSSTHRQKFQYKRNKKIIYKQWKFFQPNLIKSSRCSFKLSAFVNLSGRGINQQKENRLRWLGEAHSVREPWVTDGNIG